MKHIKTKSEEEAAADKLFAKEACAGDKKADAKTEKQVYELLDTLRKIDDLTLHASELKGDIKKFMKEAAQLTTETGKVLCTWGPGAAKKDVDYDAIMIEANVPQKIIDKHTKTKVSARSFSVEVD
jgi:hypothetical protein